MMAKAPEGRPQSAAEVVRVLAGIETSPDESKAARPGRFVLSERELRIVTVLSFAQDSSLLATDATSAVDALQPEPDTLDPSGTLRVLLERAGGKLGRFAASSCVLLFPATGVPSDRAIQAAQCALSCANSGAAEKWRWRAAAPRSARRWTATQRSAPRGC